MDDQISRQSAIDAIELTTWYHQNRNGEMVEGANSQEEQAWYKAEDVYKVLNDLPSTQPETQWIPIKWHIKMDRTIADVSFILDCLILLRDILDQGSCNDCCNKNCTCKPNPGDHVRYNCPYFEGEEGK